MVPLFSFHFNLPRIDRRLFVGMSFPDSGDDLVETVRLAYKLYPFFFDLFRFSDLSDGWVRLRPRGEPSNAANRETAVRVVAYRPAARIAYHLSKFVCIGDGYIDNDFIHILSI